MPALENPRHERFAQELAKGRTQAEAYAEAGYKPSEPNASRLRSNEKVQARIAELQERAAVRTEITVASITERLLAIATKAEMSSDAPMLQAARASLMDAAKLNGLVVEKGEHNHRVAGPSRIIIEAATDDDSKDQAAAEAGEALQQAQRGAAPER